MFTDTFDKISPPPRKDGHRIHFIFYFIFNFFFYDFILCYCFILLLYFSSSNKTRDRLLEHFRSSIELECYRYLTMDFDLTRPYKYGLKLNQNGHSILLRI